MSELSHLASAFAVLTIMAWGLYLLVYHASGRRFRYSPGEVIGLALRHCFVLAWRSLGGLIVLLVEALGGLFGARLGKHHRAKGRSVEGASFLRGIARRQLLRRSKNGLVIDGVKRISEQDSHRHLAVIAPSGTGKTTAFIIPNILQLKPNCSAVITDPSGEIYARTSGFLSRQGFEIKVLNLGSPSTSLNFNPLARAKTTTQTEELCGLLIDAAYGSGSGDQRFWNSGAQTLLSVLIQCLKREPEENQNLANVAHLLNVFGADGRPLYSFVARNADEKTFASFKGFLSNSERVLQGMAATARAALQPFADPALCQLTATETLHFETLRQRPTVIYLIVPESRIRHFRFLLGVFWTQLFAFLMEMPREGASYLPIYAFLDEFANIGRIPGFAETITAIRKRKVSVSIMLQDVEQLETLYGRGGASTILNGGCASRIYLPGLSHGTCLELEKILGRQRTIENGKETSRNLLSADEIRTLDDNAGIYVFANRRPMRLKMKPFYRSVRLRRRANLPAAPMPTEHVADVQYIDVRESSGTKPSEENHSPRPKPQKGELSTTAHPGTENRPALPQVVEQQTKREPAEQVIEQASATPSTPARSERHDETPSATSATGDPIPTKPNWATEVLQEARRARREVAGLRDALGVHVVTRKQAARILGKSTRTLQRWEGQGLLERVKVTAPGVHYDHEHVLSLKRRIP